VRSTLSTALQVRISTVHYIILHAPLKTRVGIPFRSQREAHRGERHNKRSHCHRRHQKNKHSVPHRGGRRFNSTPMPNFSLKHAVVQLPVQQLLLQQSSYIAVSTVSTDLMQTPLLMHCFCCWLWHQQSRALPWWCSNRERYCDAKLPQGSIA
jgi:hypothetical protein